MINKYLCKSLASKNGNDILIWSWNNPPILYQILAGRINMVVLVTLEVVLVPVKPTSTPQKLILEEARMMWGII